MTSPALLSDTKIRRHVKGHRFPKHTLFMHSDHYEEKDECENNKLGLRSISLTTLQPAPVSGPRMAQLETLEAKMASIEVSLSTTPRRKKNGSISGGSTGGGNKTAALRSDAITRELENLRHALRDKENVIQSLKGQLNSSPLSGGGRLPAGVLRAGGLGPGSRALSPAERRHAEERLSRVKHDMDNKRLAIKNLKMALERLDITDNIDVRIQQAELEYQLGREELNALSLLEEARALQLCLEDTANTAKPQTTLYSCTRGFNGHFTLHAIEVAYDSKSPHFGAAQRDNLPGLWVDWTLDDTGLTKGDRVIEVNGKLVLNKTKEDMQRLLSVAPDPAQIVVLRAHSQSGPSSIIPQHPATSNEVANLRAELGLVRERAEEAQRTKDGLKGDNLRLTHRISYLEEQVAELLQRKNAEQQQENRVITQSPIITSTVKNSQNITNISITSPPSSPNRNSDLQVFQKGPQVTALVANLPGMEVDNRDLLRTLRPRSVQCNVSSTHIPAPDESHHPHNYKPRHNRHSAHISRHLDYNSESSSAIEQIRRHHHNHNHHHRKHETDKTSRKSLSAVETHIHRRAAPQKYLDSRSVEDLDRDVEPVRIRDARSVKSLDFDSEPCTNNNHYAKPIKVSPKHVDYASEPNASDKKLQPNYQHSNGDLRHRPKPPKKPLRLSLHRAQSLQSVESPPQMTTVPDREDRKPTKRNHKGEAPQIPLVTMKMERPSEQPPQPPLRNEIIENNSRNNSRASSRTENGHSALRWPSPFHHITYSRGSNRNNGHVSDGGKWC